MWSAYFKQRKKKKKQGPPNGVDTAVHRLDREDLLSVLAVGFYIFTHANKRWFPRMESNLGRCEE